MIVNQHAADTWRSRALVTLNHARGSITVTPDHALWVDGVPAPARLATPGTTLTLGAGGAVVVESVHVSAGSVVNPLTPSGTIVAADAGGDPVVATTLGEWILPRFTDATGWRAISELIPISVMLARLFPRSSQAFNDDMIDPALATAMPALRTAAGHATPLAAAAAFALADATFAAGLAAHALWRPAIALAIGAIGARRLMRAK